MVKTQLGKCFLGVFFGNPAEFNVSLDVDEITSMKDKAFDKVMAILFIRASDQIKYEKCKMNIAWFMQTIITITLSR